MGWGITLNTDIYYSKVGYKSKQDVSKRIKEIDESLADIKARILQYAFMTEPKKFIPNDSEPLYYIENEINELLDEYNELCFEQSRLYILENDWDEAHHKETGLALVPYNPNELNRKWMHGDFIKSCTPDGKEIDANEYWDKYKWNVVE